MVEKKILEHFNRIFDLKKVTTWRPDPDAPEQDVLFVTFGSIRSSIRQGTEHHRVEGSAVMYSQLEKMPIGFFAKKIQTAEIDDTKNFFFNQVDESGPTFGDIATRSFQFVYLYSGQYNPPAGTIQNVEFNEGGEE